MGKYIVLGLLALLALIFFAPVKAEVLWRREVLSLKLRLLWLFPVKILPQEEKPEKPRRKKKPKKAKAKKDEKEKKPKRKRDPAELVMEILRLVNDLIPRVGEFFGRVTRGITVSRCRIALVITGEEADQVGIACGRAYAVGYGAYSVLAGAVKVREFVYNVMPDFLAEKGASDAEVTVQVRPVTLLAAGCILLFHVVKAFIAGKGPKLESRR